jgi:hypothetical protein
MSDCDFLNDAPVADEGSVLEAELGRYVAELLDAQRLVAEAEQLLKEREKVLRKLDEEVLPDIMTRANIDMIGTAYGNLVLKEDLKARIPSDPFARERALEWLREHNAEALIKSEVVISETEDQKISEELIDSLRRMGLSFSKSETVNTNSLAAFFRELLGIKKGSIATMQSDEIPPEFSLYRYRKVSLKAR